MSQYGIFLDILRTSTSKELEVLLRATADELNRKAVQEQQSAEANTRRVPRVDEANPGVAGPAQSIRKIPDSPDTRHAVTDLHVAESGATSSHVPLRYDLIPVQLLFLAAKRYTIGAKVHGERGYQQGLADRDFIINRINHITEHWNKLFHPTPIQDNEGLDDHLGAILWGIGFIAEVSQHKNGAKVLAEIIKAGASNFNF